MQLEEVKQHALQLPLKDRAALAHELLLSLDELSEEEVEKLWIKEAERRVDRYDAGQAKTYSAEEVFQSIEDDLSQ